MIELLNPKLNKYLSLLEGSTFTFSAESQLQDLENYTCGYSFDVELINDDVLRDSLEGGVYDSGETEIIDVPELGIHKEIPKMLPNKVIMIVNGVRLYAGDLVMLETTPISVKCSYQCMPYGAMRNFILRPTLRDYLNMDGLATNELYEVFEPGVPYLHTGAKNGAELSFYVWNNNTLNPKIRANASQGWYVGSDNLLEGKYWISTPVNKMLKAMGIEAPDMENEDMKLFMPCNIKYTRLFKFRFQKYVQGAEPMPYVHYNKKVYRLPYVCTPVAPVWVWNEGTQTWEEIDSLLSAGYKRIPFLNTIRVNKSLEGMEFYQISQVGFNSKIGNLQLGTEYLDNVSIFGYGEGYKWQQSFTDLGFSIYFNDTSSAQAIVSALIDAPEYLDIVFKIDCDKSFSNYIMNADWADVPFSMADLSFFDISTNEFLNQLSLCSKHYSWLRNPMFISDKNHKDIYGIENKDYIGNIYLCDEKRLISLKKEIKTDAPSALRMQYNIGANTSTVKRLNNLGNKEKKVEPSIVSFAYTTDYNFETDETVSTLPIYFNTLQNKILDNDILAVVGSTKLVKRMTTGYVNNFVPDDTNCDFVFDYSDQSEKYKFTVVGYQLQEKLNFDGQVFNVSKYSTKDFITFELECYKTTTWTGHDTFLSTNTENAEK